MYIQSRVQVFFPRESVVRFFKYDYFFYLNLEPAYSILRVINTHNILPPHLPEYTYIFMRHSVLRGA